MAFSWVNLVGFAAASCTTLSFVPQVFHVWRTRRADGISVAMYAVFIVGVLLWCAYGVALDAWPIIVSNLVTTALASMVLWMRLRYSVPSPLKEQSP